MIVYYIILYDNDSLILLAQNINSANQLLIDDMTKDTMLLLAQIHPESKILNL